MLTSYVPRSLSLMANSRPLVLLVQLPIPPPGPQPIQGNIPLAAGYLKLFARKQGLEESYRIEILPSRLANDLGDRGLAEEILAGATDGRVHVLFVEYRSHPLVGPAAQAGPARVGRSCSAGRNHRPTTVGSWKTRPWITRSSAKESRRSRTCSGCYAGQATHGAARAWEETSRAESPGLWSRTNPSTPPFRKPLGNLDEVSSPYLADILDAAEERTMFLETVRGCVFKCKFCYYPKSYDASYFVSREKIAANLEHARQRGVREVVLLDPTLNQRPRFCRLSATPGGTQSRPAVHLLRRVAGRRDQGPNGAAIERGELLRSGDRDSSRSIRGPRP